MSGLEPNIINLITDNLRDRYDSGFPVLKELIQNANDAKATRFSFGHHPGFEGQSSHPLLIQPALWFFNDGHFKEEDKDAIRSFGINSKAGDASTIGKFGLGMKSVFHLAEAFLYLGMPSRETLIREIINPWDNKRPNHLHSEWNQVEEADWQLLEGLARSQQTLEQGDTGFFLWLPLRTRALLGSTGPIIQCYPGDADSGELGFLQKNDLPALLAAVLAMLPSLARTTYEHPERGFDLQLKTSPDGGRLALLGGEAANIEARYRIEGANAPLHVAAKHFPAAEMDAYFFRLKDQKVWPKSYFRNPETGLEELAPDKSSPEGAVVISHMDGDVGELTVDWAVFLPLEEHSISIPIPASSRRYRITLHGQFFVDAGRKGIFGFEALFSQSDDSRNVFDESSLRRTWNRSLVDRVVLPMLLPALKFYCEAWAVKDEQIRQLTGALESWLGRVDLGGKAQSLRRTVANGGSWIRILRPQGAVWRLQEDEVTLLPIPAPPESDKGRPWDVFPKLAELGVPFDADAPSITERLTQWDENATLEAIRSLDVVKLFTKGGLDYLSKWLGMSSTQQLPYLNTPSCKSALVAKLREGLIRSGLAGARRLGKSLSSVFSSLTDRCVAVGTRDASAASSVSEACFQALWEIDSEQLLIPKDLFDQNVGAPPDQSSLVEWLAALQPLMERDEHAVSAMWAASMLLDGLRDAGERQLFLSRNRDLRVIQAMDVKTGRDQSLSWRRINDLWNQKALFAMGTSTGGTPESLRLLADALPEQPIFQLKREYTEAVFGTGHRLPSAERHLEILVCVFTSNSRLGSLEARRRLIDALSLPTTASNDEGQFAQARLGMRYLLHGNAAQRPSNAELWIRNKGTSPVWQKLWTMVESAAPWQIINESLSENLKAADYARLGINSIDRLEVVKRLSSANCQDIDANDLTEEERNEVLQAVTDEEAWRRLPLHRIVAETEYFGCIESDVYRAGELELPPALKTKVRLICLSADPVVQHHQREWVKQLSAEAVVSLTLSSDDRGKYWSLILDGMSAQSSGFMNIDTQLRNRGWLPLAGGNVVAPANVIHIVGQEDELERLASKTGYRFATKKMLLEEVRRHPAYHVLAERLIPSGSRAFETLLRALEFAPSYAIGSLPVETIPLIERALPALIRIQTLPGWKLLSEAARLLQVPVWDRLTEHRTQAQLSINALVEVLNELARQAGPSDQAATQAHLLYLHCLAKHPECDKTVVAKLLLRAKDSSWKHAHELCADATGIDESYLIDDDERQALSDFIYCAGSDLADTAVAHPTQIPNHNAVPGNAPKLASEYFKGWEVLTKGSAVGSLLATLGPSFEPLSQHYLGTAHSIEHIRRKLCGGSLNPATQQGSNTLAESVESKTLIVLLSIVENDIVQVPNLLGTPVSFPLKRNPQMLVVGAPYRVKVHEHSAFLLQLSPSSNFIKLDGSQLSEVLKRTTQYLIRTIHKARHDFVDELWRELNQSDQLELAIAKRKILDSLPFYLEQLGAHREPPIKAKLERADEEHTKYFSAIHHKAPSNEIAKAQARYQSRLEDVARCLTDVPAAQALVLSRVKSKLREYQYEPDAVLFELFQNADDAAVELARCEANGSNHFVIPEQARRFVAQADRSAVRIMHWGRLINYRGPHGLAGRWHGFADDLKKMLILSASDKPDDESVTGRFGLGFKSVFLVCDRPRIVSGDLRLEIHGGILPDPWTDSEGATQILSEHTDDLQHRGTLIELEMPQASQETVLGRFEQHSGLLSVFSRAIRHIRLQTPGSSRVASWMPHEISSDIEIGETYLPTSPDHQTRLLIVRSSTGDVAIRLTPSGCEPVDKGVPPIWVTAPTRETDRIGFIINGAFKIDPGRGRLAGNKTKNIALLKSLGDAFGCSLAKLSIEERIPETWKAHQRKLGLVEEKTPAEFWGGLWKLLGERTITKASSDLAGMVGEFVGSAFDAWVKSGGEIPNGLPGTYATFVQSGNVDGVIQVDDSWARQGILEKLQRLTLVQNDESDLISTSVAALLRKAGLVARIRTVDINALIKGHCKQEECSPNAAAALEALICELESNGIAVEIDPQLTSKLRFLTTSQLWATAQELLCHATGADYEDERLRLEFAPKANRLDHSYDKGAVSFFIRCRGRLQAPSTTLAEWILHADMQEHRLAGLRYLALGQLGRDVAERVRNKSWLNGITFQDPLLGKLPHEDRLPVWRALAPDQFLQGSTAPQFFPAAPPPPYYRGEKALEAIYTWWKTEGAPYRQKHLDSLFPGGALEGLAFTDGEVNRTAWMTLFAIGVFQRLGRVKASQSRGFIEYMQKRRWWDVICERHPEEHGDSWLGILKGFAEGGDSGQHYDYWLDTFPRLYQLAYWLDQYVALFEGIRFRSPMQLDSEMFLKPVTDASLQGAGWSAPAIDRTMKMGAHIVVRELLRNKVIKNPAAHRLAYMPAARILRLFEAIGVPLPPDCRGPAIWDALVRSLGPEEATFCGDFDIPLLVLAEDENLLYGICNAVIEDDDDEFNMTGISA
ncbi:hypothetical protein CEW87_14020 [Parazoarcus communis]|uniref:Sacsin/Nov domain-containing protein n=1 Tax=Parazoarcus communis TaxID=41977 RepID=A0A2U8H5A1_9RHOO|nr:hypothetical protein [Parazoarcus communis]AWI80376.1 hypothetical protein CEW87_14020 [Parazoarcus communis]